MVDGDAGSLVQFGADVRREHSRAWHLEQLRPFLENPDAQGPAVVARYHGPVFRESEQKLWLARGLSYGILEVLPGLIGREWVTFPGHVHRGPRRTSLPSVAEVMHGYGGVYLQGVGPRYRESSIVWLHPGDRIILPPGFGHAWINAGTDPFILAEVHASRTEYDFVEVARHRGMGFYFGPDGWRQNLHYRELEMVREVSAGAMAAPETPGRDLYQAALKYPDRFKLLDPFQVPSRVR
jgi:glucose-6-phosphate isomerase